MPELARRQSVSRSALLELQNELRLVNDGYEFLDEKRILLASEMLRQRRAWQEAYREFTVLCEQATQALAAAAADQGLDGLQVRPAASLPGARLEIVRDPFLGQEIVEARFDPGEWVMVTTPVRDSPAVRHCIDAHTGIVTAGAALAAIAINLKRLMHEYRRTERRVRALENVVLPEIRSDIAMMEEHLDLNEQEEVIRVRSIRPTVP
jgi:V/A-type H+-transporting ATPase subunit D